jgi:hypothetical protein
LQLKVFRRAGLAIAIASTAAGAIIAILPALVVAIVNLFYDSAGGVLILLGSLITLLPHPALAPAGGGSSLPAFQTLDAHVGLVLLRSLSATVLCSAAFAAIAGECRRGSRTPWLTVAGGSLGAAIIAGHAAAIALSPAIAISVFHLARATRRILS